MVLLDSGHCHDSMVTGGENQWGKIKSLKFFPFRGDVIKNAELPLENKHGGKGVGLFEKLLIAHYL